MWPREAGVDKWGRERPGGTGLACGTRAVQLGGEADWFASSATSTEATEERKNNYKETFN